MLCKYSVFHKNSHPNGWLWICLYYAKQCLEKGISPEPVLNYVNLMSVTASAVPAE